MDKGKNEKDMGSFCDEINDYRCFSLLWMDVLI